MTNKLIGALLSESKIGVLRLLLLKPDQAFYQREIAEKTGLRLRAVQQALRPLVEGGIVRREARGRQVFYQADPSCSILSELTAILLKTVGLAEVLRRALGGLADRIEVALVFGSMARGEAVAESDVDLMVIGEVGLRELNTPRFLAGIALYLLVGYNTLGTRRRGTLGASLPGEGNCFFLAEIRGKSRGPVTSQTAATRPGSCIFAGVWVNWLTQYYTEGDRRTAERVCPCADFFERGGDYECEARRPEPAQLIVSRTTAKASPTCVLRWQP